MTMQVISDHGQIDDSVGGTAVSIGVFDGVHLGHRVLLGRLCENAKMAGLATAVITFDKHPAHIIRPENAPLLLTTLEQKLELLEEAGIDYVYLVNFDNERSRAPASVFFREAFVEGVRAKSIVVGEDFHFGNNREGNVELLHREGEASGIDVVDIALVKVTHDSPEPVSSTAIRRKLAGGDIEAVSKMLGRSFEIRGTVVEGDKRGRSIGFPTANIPVPKIMAWPADGVYAGWYIRPGRAPLMTAINIGRRPTFYEHAEQSLLEAHILDFDEDIYGEQAQIQFACFLRSEYRFDGVAALTEQLKKDVERSRMVLSEIDFER